MSYQVKQGNIFGRLGTGIAQGIAEQMPKEIARARKAEGLRQFEQDYASLSPMQQLARLSALDLTPQETASFAELAKQQQARNAYRQFQDRGQQQYQPPGTAAQTVPSVREQFQRDAANINLAGIKPTPAASPTNAPAARAGEPVYGTTPEISPVNPLSDIYREREPWTPQRRNREVADILDAGLTQDPIVAQQMAKENEAAELSAPKVAKANAQYLEDVRKEANDELQRQLEIKTQKKGADIYKDISGDTLISIQRNIEKDLRENPKASRNEVVRHWVDKGFDFAKAKPIVDKLAGRDSWDWMFKHGETVDKLKKAAKIYADMNAEEELYNKLITRSSPGKPGTDKTPAIPPTLGYDMSPQGAAQIAFPRSEKVQSIVNKYNPKTDNTPLQNAEMLAAQVKANLTDKDSILAIAKDIADKDPFFDEQVFFDYLDQNASLNPRQRRELIEGKKGMLPSWGDEWINWRRLK